MDESRLEMELPGFRFHPTEEELLDFYLKNMVLGKKIRHIIGCLNIYRYDPWDLPGHAKVGEREWYFFVGRETRHGSGRPNRTTEKGFWKATGSDRKIYSLSNPNPNRMIGLKKTLVFYQGRAPHGSKTDWVMNEYRLPDSISSSSSHKNIVLCKIYRKATSIKVLEQRAAMEDDEYTIHNNAPIHNPQTFLTINNNKDAAKHTMLQLSHQFSNDNISVTTTSTTHTASSSSSSSLLLSLQSGEVQPSKLELPPKSDCWLQEQDPLWHQLRSPWLLNDFMPLTPLPNLHHF